MQSAIDSTATRWVMCVRRMSHYFLVKQYLFFCCVLYRVRCRDTWLLFVIYIFDDVGLIWKQSHNSCQMHVIILHYTVSSYLDQRRGYLFILSDNSLRLVYDFHLQLLINLMNFMLNIRMYFFFFFTLYSFSRTSYPELLTVSAGFPKQRYGFSNCSRQ